MINLGNIGENRYARLESISWWKQDVLKKSKILVIGGGALGNEIVKNLAMLGIGNIFIVDMDKVEKSNLTRSVLFRKDDEGKSKAKTLCSRAKEINDELNIKYFDGNVFELGLGIFKNMDLVICGLDNREARLFVNQSCWKVNRPWIDGAIEILNGIARMFIPPDGSCYECTLNEVDYKLMNKRKSCMLLGLDDIIQGKIPTTPTVSSVIAGIEVQEAVKYLHNKEMISLNGKGFVFNGITNESYLVEYPKKDDCPSHYTFKDVEKAGAQFSGVTINYLIEYGGKNLKTDKFSIEFNNEIVYELSDEKGKAEKYYANLNLLTQKDIVKNGKLFKVNSFHSLASNSDLAKKLKNKKLQELHIPYNDIITLKSREKEIHLEFESDDIFI
jgi:molybdopterin/thiamine biosynthesis adenylyltransferase